MNKEQRKAIDKLWVNQEFQIFLECLRENKRILQDNRLRMKVSKENLNLLRDLQVQESMIDFVLGYNKLPQEPQKTKKEIFHSDEEIVKNSKEGV